MPQIPRPIFPRCGNPGLNLPFVANLSNTHLGLEPLDELAAKDYGAVEDFDAEADRNIRVFTLWLKLFGAGPSIYTLFENLRDGLIILQAYDELLPGSVIWRHVSKQRKVVVDLQPELRKMGRC